MFKRIKCKRCGEKIKSKYSFCPGCGNRVNQENEEDYGLLGKNDFKEIENELKLPFGMNSILNSLINNLEVNVHDVSDKIERDLNSPKKRAISISISRVGGGKPNIKFSESNQEKIEKEKIKEKLQKNYFTSEKIKKFSSLKKEEPKTDLRRLSNRVIYELEMPKVHSIDDISIVKLENSIEIKAIGKDVGYTKIIPISLPIKNYEFSKGKLVLELGLKH
jgi:hypothetical protein